MLSSLAIRDYRLYWIGMFVSLCGTWIQWTAQNWLVYDLSGSPFLLGLVVFVTHIPILLFSLFTGVIVDRKNKKNILLLTQAGFMVLAFILAIITQLRIVTVNAIMIIALFNGIIFSLDAPARLSIIVELVGKKNLLNAIALNSLAFHSARMIGPALGGLIIAYFSVAGCFFLNAVSFLAFIFVLLLIKPESTARNNNNHFMDDLKGGIRFIRNNPIYVVLMSIVGIVSFFGFSYVILMPIFAKDIFGMGPKGYGFLLSAGGIGSILAAIFLARLKDSKKQPQILLVSLFLFAFSMIAFSISRSFFLSCFILTFGGFSSLSIFTIVNSLIQSSVPDEYRGRVMSMFMLTFAGTIPFGSLLAGSLASLIGADKTVTFFGLSCLILFLILSKKLRSMKDNLSCIKNNFKH